jgi:hypothetical protein
MDFDFEEKEQSSQSEPGPDPDPFLFVVCDLAGIFFSLASPPKARAPPTPRAHHEILKILLSIFHHDEAQFTVHTFSSTPHSIREQSLLYP